MNRCRKEKSFKYTSRRTPSYSANKCKSMKKKGNDGNLYKSVSNKKGVYRWIKIRKKKKNISKAQSKKISLKNLRQIASKYNISKSGRKKQIAKRLIELRGKVLKVKDKNELKVLLNN